MGEGQKTIIPTKGTAKISCRLVPNQLSVPIYEKLKAYIAQIAPPTVRWDFRLLETGEPAVIDRHSPAVQAAIAAYERTWGKRPFFVREGGSIPVVVDLKRELQSQMVLLSFGYKGCAAHGPNEHVYLDMWYRGIHTMINFYDEISQRTFA